MVKQTLVAKSGSRIPSGISKRSALALHRTMVRIRRTEEALLRDYRPREEMRCPVHFCVGQEGPPAGVCLNLRPDDLVFTGHRSHGFYLAKGGSMDQMFAELNGKVTGSNSGKAGHHELSDEAVSFYSGAIVSGTVPIAAGAALACQMKNRSAVAVAVFGDGAADQGVVYETLNVAALKRLPLVFICENNFYSTYSSQSARQPICDIAGRARAFGVPARRLCGNDSLAVYRAARQAIARARKGLGPTFLELETYRWGSHVGPEDDDYLGYRPPEEIAEWKERCPIKALEGLLLETGNIDEPALKSIIDEIDQEIERAFEFARSSPFPEPTDLTTQVFGTSPVGNAVPIREMSDSPFDHNQAEALVSPY